MARNAPIVLVVPGLPRYHIGPYITASFNVFNVMQTRRLGCGDLQNNRYPWGRKASESELVAGADNR
ncbi:hypothetical protein L915_01465 [Phytophthora nicotianae]|uniref:Uncharacterized protein n=2 Tax=Phytophthora nicotianae TaxID=4792 RepID=V9FYH4_PHYNI|nr:hypothetical protein F443_01536 [Phytophthora nicotianae P1569]ETK95628.1 hypothetical protein L915_01465 [Phytophthora nicotianae]